jgi:hypothetical protein
VGTETLADPSRLGDEVAFATRATSANSTSVGGYCKVMQALSLAI